MKFRKAGKSRPVNKALVLGGGGAKGAYQLGVVKELLQRGRRPDLITGSSIGALNGALLAEFIYQGLSDGEISQKLQEVWQKVDRFMTLNWLGILFNILTPSQIPSLFVNTYIKRLLQQYISPERRFSDYTECQLSVTGTNLEKKCLKIFDFNAGVPVCRAVLASMTYPAAFPPVQIENEHYIDGGALDNAPLKEAILWGAEEIVIVFLKPLIYLPMTVEEPESGRDYPVLKVISELVELAANTLMYGDLKRAEEINSLLKLLNEYSGALPPDFLSRISRLFGLKHQGGKRIIKITKIAPRTVLDPPGSSGFDQQRAIESLISLGEEDARRILS